MSVIRETLRERLYAGLVPCPDPGCECLLWTGRTDRNGYGRIPTGNRAELVHRVMWKMTEGPIPDGLDLDHVKARGCRHRHCASVAHLEPVTRAENNRRRGATGLAVVNAAKTHCDSGHEYDLFNTYWKPDGFRDCRACIRERVARYKARRSLRGAA